MAKVCVKLEGTLNVPTNDAALQTKAQIESAFEDYNSIEQAVAVFKRCKANAGEVNVEAEVVLDEENENEENEEKQEQEDKKEEDTEEEDSEESTTDETEAEKESTQSEDTGEEGSE